MPPARHTSAWKFQSTRPSRGETNQYQHAAPRRNGFQSTRPSRGETNHLWARTIQLVNFNPLAPRGARRGTISLNLDDVEISIHSPLAGRDKDAQRPRHRRNKISIHSPLAGRDQHHHAVQPLFNYFNPLAPRGARLLWAGAPPPSFPISIHSPLAGRDDTGAARAPELGNFNPLAPRGARLTVLAAGTGQGKFQSTRPSRGETPWRRCWGVTAEFQSTRPSRGETHEQPHAVSCGADFNPLAPRGARPPLMVRSMSRSCTFQSTRPSRGETLQDLLRKGAGQVFQSTRPSRGETRRRFHFQPGRSRISIHSPLAGRDSKQ